MPEVDLMGPDPLYEQIAAVVAARIADGTYELQRPIPGGELGVAAEFKVSRNTVRAAFERLAEQGVVRRVRGKGTYAVAKPPAEPGGAGGQESGSDSGGR